MAKVNEFVVATLTVSFSDESSTGGAGIKLEIDDREDGSNGGDTSFKPGDVVGFLQFVDGNVDVVDGYPQSVAGSVAYFGDGNKDVLETVNFTNSDSANLSYPPFGTVDMEWLGQVFEVDDKAGKVTPYDRTFPNISFSSLSIPGGKKVIGALRCTYIADGECYKLTVDKQTAKDFKEVMVFSIGQVTESV